MQKKLTPKDIKVLKAINKLWLDYGIWPHHLQIAMECQGTLQSRLSDWAHPSLHRLHAQKLIAVADQISLHGRRWLVTHAGLEFLDNLDQ